MTSWIRGAWGDVVRDVLLDRRAHERGIVNSAAIERLLATASAPSFGGREADAVWSLLNLEIWYRTFIDGQGVQTLPAPGTVSSPRSRFDAETAHRWSTP